MLKIKSDLNLSNRGIIKVAASFRAGTKNRKAIEPGLKLKLNNTAHSVNNYFDFKKFPFVCEKAMKSQMLLRLEFIAKMFLHLFSM